MFSVIVFDETLWNGCGIAAGHFSTIGFIYREVHGQENKRSLLIVGVGDINWRWWLYAVLTLSVSAYLLLGNFVLIRGGVGWGGVGLGGVGSFIPHPSGWGC